MLMMMFTLYLSCSFNINHFSTIWRCFDNLSLLYLVDGETDGVQRGSCAALSPPAFLHECHHYGAALFPIIRLIVILLSETQSILRVCPESVCVTMDKKRSKEIPKLVQMTLHIIIYLWIVNKWDYGTNTSVKSLNSQCQNAIFYLCQLILYGDKNIFSPYHTSLSLNIFL